MPRTSKLLLLIPALAVLLCAAEARAVVQGEDREEIRTLVQAVAGEKKKDPETWFRLGIEYNRAGDMAKARNAFKQALKLRPTFVAARAGLAYTFFVEKDFNTAEKEAYRGTEKEAYGGTSSPGVWPRDFPATHVLAAVRLQRYREVAAAALEHANEALAKDPDAADWNLLKAETLIALSIPEQKIPPDLVFSKPNPPPDEATLKATREEDQRRDKEAADCLEKYLRLGRPVVNGDHLRRQLEALRFYSEEHQGADRLYASSEVTSKAVITYKPEPDFTPEARRANLLGVVRLRATLASDGKIKHILVVMPLPHGLSGQAIQSAQAIKFTPAMVNGAPVSQRVILEYNFSVY